MGKTPDEVVLDFSGVRPFEPLDPNVVYLCSISALDLSKSKEGKPKSHCELTILEPDEVNVEEWVGSPGERKPGAMLETKTKAKGRKLFREFSLQPDALPFLHTFLRAVDPDIKLDEKFSYRPGEYVGMQVGVRVVNEEYDEQIRSRPKTFHPASAYKG